MMRLICLMSLSLAAGCVAYEPQPYEDTNADGHVTFYDDNPHAQRGFERHIARQSADYREEDESTD